MTLSPRLMILLLASPLAGLSGFACWIGYEQGKAAAIRFWLNLQICLEKFGPCVVPNPHARGGLGEGS